MSTRWSALLTVPLTCMICGCGAESSTGQFVTAASTDAGAAATSQSNPVNPVPEKSSARHIIREGELRFETSDRDQTRAAIRGFAAVHQAYFAEDKEHRSTDALEQVMVIRVPAEQFDGLLDDVSRGIRWFDVRKIHAIDVTEEFVDIEARVMTKKATEQRYRELLTQANAVEDVLKIEEQMDKLRAEIESTEGRLRLMKDRESYSTLRVSFYETLARSSGFWTRLTRSLSAGWMCVVEGTIAAAALWPLLVLVAVVTVLVRRRGRLTVSGRVAS